MGQLASDNFQRANENPLSDGGNWSTILGEHANQIVSNLCEGTATPSRSGDFYSGITWPNDQYSEITLWAIGGTGSVSPVVRCSSSAENYYQAPINGLGSGETVTLYYVTGGAGHFLGNSSSFTAAQGGVLKLQAQGTTISVWYNGTQELAVTDSTYSSGSAGFFTQTSSTLSATQISAWDGGNFQQAAPTFSPAPGTYSSAQSVTLSSPGADAIYYTVDGSTPTTSSTLYSGSIQINSTTTIKAIATKAGLANSTVASAVYTFTLAFIFYSAIRKNFPAQAQPGTLWFETVTRDLYVAVADPNEFFPGESDNQNVTTIWSEGLTVTPCLRANVPSVAAVGTIFLTTDTFEAFAGTGIGVLAFNLDVHRALRGLNLPQQDRSGRVSIAAPATNVYYVLLG